MYTWEVIVEEHWDYYGADEWEQKEYTVTSATFEAALKKALQINRVGKIVKNELSGVYKLLALRPVSVVRGRLLSA